MRNFKKVISWAIGFTFLCGSALPLVGCGRSEFEEEVDESKTQLIVSNYEGGFGSDWLYDMKAKFEESYSSVEYDSGKYGAQILIDGNKTEGDGFTWGQTEAHVAFIEKLTSQYILSMASQGQLLPLTDVMDSILAQENVSLDADLLAALKVLDGKNVYHIPHYEGGGGIVYDKDIFDEYSLYISNTGGWTNASGNLSVGGDGIEGTLDDGLPATYKQFFSLCLRMKQNSITPVIISGEWKNAYHTMLLDRATVAYDGMDTVKAFLNYDGSEGQYVTEITESDDFFGYTAKTEKSAINETNAYYNNQRAGRLYALELLNMLISKNYFDVGGWASTKSHLDAQDMYIRSVKNNEPIAMLIDGSWWENEASPVFESLGATNSQYKKHNRNYGWMALPTKVDENDTNTSKDSMATINHLNACVIVRSDLTEGQKKLAKDFIKFCYTEENLEAFTVKTGTTRVFKYKISDEAYNSLTPYQKDIWKLHDAGQFILEDSASQFYMQNKKSMFQSIWSSSNAYMNPLQQFSAQGNQVTAKQFFESLWETPEDWNDRLKK